MTPKNKLPIEATLDFVQEHFEYRRETGEFFHRKTNPKNRMPKGAPVGCAKTRSNRVIVHVLDTLITRSRLIWLIETGSWPAGYIRHKNGNTLDDRFENLYESSQSKDFAVPRKRVRTYQRTTKEKLRHVEGIDFLPRRGVFYVKALGKYYPDLKTAQRALEAA